MSKTVQFLVAAASIVVIAAGSFWLYDRNQMRRAAKADAELREQIRDAERFMECRALLRDKFLPGAARTESDELRGPFCAVFVEGSAEEARDCSALISAWENNFFIKSPFTVKRLSYCETVVSSSTPSEQPG
ncbi:hypothetical protein [Paracoccus sp. (in: a-proteobacteria)]|uniref:hypothetical protein n=1 Tax=Paracoccus sp. TaxID=267 RepID=UPI002AFDCBC7|nr:hypothetical protein [Paracoccus sp. (in: a-proteobacteria)]